MLIFVASRAILLLVLKNQIKKELLHSFSVFFFLIFGQLVESSFVCVWKHQQKALLQLLCVFTSFTALLFLRVRTCVLILIISSVLTREIRSLGVFNAYEDVVIVRRCCYLYS